MDQIDTLLKRVIENQVDSAILTIGLGGGCVAGSCNVYTRFGLESFEDFYERIKELGKLEIRKDERSCFIDIRDFNVFTYSLNDKTGKFEKNKINEVWKWKVDKKDTVTVTTETSVKSSTSSWHPYFVYEEGKIVEKQAKDIKVNDLLLQPNAKDWLFRKNEVVDGIELDEDICWLVGYFLGDGSSYRSKSRYINRLGFWCDAIETLEKAKRIFHEKFNYDAIIKKAKDRNCYEMYVGQKNVADLFLKIAEANYGSKVEKITVPKAISRCTKESLFAFIAGYFDADGFATNRYICFSSISKPMLDTLSCLLQVFGIKTSVTKTTNSKNRDTKNWKDSYLVRIAADRNKLTELMEPHVTNPKRKKMILSYKDFDRRSIPIDFDWLTESLKKIGLNPFVKLRTIQSGDFIVSLHDFVQRASSSITIPKLRILCSLVKDKIGKSNDEIFQQFVLLEQCLDSLVCVTKIEKGLVDEDFYDFSMEKYANYVAGTNGLTTIHNTGAGSVIPMIEAISRTGVPIVVLCALPMANEGSLAKANAVKTLDKIARIAASGNELIQTLIVVDNSRIEEMYPQIAAGRFWDVANFDIANNLHVFNALTACDSRHASLDPTDFTKILTAGNCTIYGKVEVPILIEDGEIVMSEDELAKAVIRNVEKGLLAEGFNIKETTRAGVLVAANQGILNLMPAVNINYALDALTEALGGASLFHGVYEDDNDKNVITVYTMLSGIGLPRERVDKLLADAEAELEKIDQKQADKSKMQVFDQNQTVEREKTGYQKMKDRNTTFGRMIANKQRRSRG